MQSKPLLILISPLDWGLGHASRCIPIIHQLTEAGHKVTLAGSGRSLILLQKEFPHLESIELKGFSPSFSGSDMPLHLFMLLPRFIATMFREHKTLNKLIKLHHFDIILSDNRYGLWNKKVKSIIITHQVMIKAPVWLKFLEYILYLISRFLISRFDACWIPDYKEPPGLSGDLAHKYPLPENAIFIGPLTRLVNPGNNQKRFFGNENLTAIVSGPEPQRSIFEDILKKQMAGLNQNAIIISGKPESAKKAVIDGTLTILPHLSVEEMSSVIESSSVVICRSGYSSIMDLQAMGAKALFVPTPGQTEQIYLAELHQKTGTAMWQAQEKLNLETDIENALKYKGFGNYNPGSGLSEAIAELKKK